MTNMKNTLKSNLSGAIRRTLKEEMAKDDRIFLIGEDIADPYGGIHKVTKGLSNTYGKDRVINSPLSEIAIAGAGIGAAISGMRPIIEFMYADFLPIAMDQIVNCAAKMHFLSGGKINVPLVIRANYGTGKGEGSQHSQCPIGWFMNVPGIKIVAPSTPRDAQGLIKSAIEDNNPVLFLEHKILYAMTGEIEEKNTAIPIGKANIKREGIDLTIIACSLMVQYALKAAEELATEGINVEVIDLRTIKPFDKKAILSSVKKTGRLLTVEEGPFTGGYGATITDFVASNAFNDLKCAPIRLAAADTPLIASIAGEKMLIPSIEKIKDKVKIMVNNT